jgi:putative ABC transport system ATP-binding protein
VAENTDGLVIRSLNVVRTYKVDKFEVHALRGVNFFVRPGEFVGLIGRSGSGKTTLINIVGGLDHPTSVKCMCTATISSTCLTAS